MFFFYLEMDSEDMSNAIMYWKEEGSNFYSRNVIQSTYKLYPKYLKDAIGKIDSGLISRA